MMTHNPMSPQVKAKIIGICESYNFYKQASMILINKKLVSGS